MASIFLIFFVSIVVSSENVTIDTQLGFITGIDFGNYFVFRGIPYTEQIPIGPNRFIESSVKITPYNDTFDATEFGDICIQVPNERYPEDMSEDCLYINIFTPNLNTSADHELLPVMFWIHGGGFTYGSGSLILYDGAGLMENEDIVYVSINYRLGSLGYLSLESILTETNYKTTGGMNGINDIIIALKWVQSNIIDFGGDSSKITIFGESAGGFAICMLMVSPESIDLFDQSVIQSGPCLRNIAGSKQEGLENSKNALDSMDLNDNLDELKELDADIFLDFSVGPSVDGYYLNDSLFNIYNEDIINLELNTNKLIIGTVSMDTVYTFPYFVSNAVDRGPNDENELKQYLETYIDDKEQIDMIQNIYYPIDDYVSFTYNDNEISRESMLWYNMNADVCFICPTFNFVELMIDSNISNEIYLYNFLGPSEPYYVPHGGELPFVFNSSQVAKEYFGTEWSNDLSYHTSEIWKNYAIYGVPNSSVFNDEWVPFVNDGLAMLLKDNDGEIVLNYDTQYRNDVCSFWLQNPLIMGTLCSQSLAIKKPSDDTGLETWEIVVIAIGSFLVIVILAIIIKYKFCVKNSDDYNQMDNNATQLAKNQNNDYGAIDAEQ